MAAKQPTGELVAAKQPALRGGGGKTATPRGVEGYPGAGGGETASSVAVVAAKQPPHAEWSSTSELVAAKQPALAGGGGKTATRREVLTRPGRLAEVTIE